MVLYHASSMSAAPAYWEEAERPRYFLGLGFVAAVVVGDRPRDMERVLGAFSFSPPREERRSSIDDASLDVSHPPRLRLRAARCLLLPRLFRDVSDDESQSSAGSDMMGESGRRCRDSLLLPFPPARDEVES